MEEKECYLCGHKTAKIELMPDNNAWEIVKCKNCFNYHIHLSVIEQFFEKEDEKEINKRRRLNSVYNFLLNKPFGSNNHDYKFFYEDETKNNQTHDPTHVNVASLLDEMPKTTKEKLKKVLNNLFTKYNEGEDIEAKNLDLGLMLIEQKKELQSILTYFADNDYIRITMLSADNIVRFKLTIKAKIFLEEGENMQINNKQITNITNNDNSININNSTIKKATIGTNDITTQKETIINTNVDVKVENKQKKNLFEKFLALFKRK